MKTEQRKIAIIATSHNLMGTEMDSEPTGVWLEELVAPYYTFVDQGIAVDVYSVQGKEIPIDPRSVNRKGENEQPVERYLDDEQLQQMFKHTRPISAINLDDYDGVFLPGGHGAVWDFSPNPVLGKLVAETLSSGKIMASVCHGPAGLLDAYDDEGQSLIRGRRLTGFSNSEEKASGFDHTVPYALETELKERGAEYVSGNNFEPFAVQDGNLITGQNPASSTRMAEVVVKALNLSSS